MNYNFQDRTILAMDLARKAGEEILRISQNNNLDTKEKGTKDVVTVADTKSEKIIIKGIEEKFSNDSIIAEESGTYHRTENGYTWVIDPLDGTSNYSRGIPLYCVSIGYMKNNKPMGGAIYIPTTNELFVCEIGKGAYCNNKRLQVSTTSNLEKSLTTIGFNNRYPEMTAWFSEIHKNTMEKCIMLKNYFLLSYHYVM